MNLSRDASFRAYVDESGDEGFVFREDGSGSSRWFVISALVMRVKKDLSVVECLKETRKLLGKPPKHPLHFVDLKHEQRVPYGEAEPAYAQHLRKTFYRNKGQLHGYGLKLWPDPLNVTQTKAPEANNLEGL